MKGLPSNEGVYCLQSSLTRIRQCSSDMGDDGHQDKKVDQECTDGPPYTEDTHKASIDTRL